MAIKVIKEKFAFSYLSFHCGNDPKKKKKGSSVAVAIVSRDLKENFIFFKSFTSYLGRLATTKQ